MRRLKKKKVLIYIVLDLAHEKKNSVNENVLFRRDFKNVHIHVHVVLFFFTERIKF